MWKMLNEKKSNIYDELLLETDIDRKVYALKKGDWKIIAGKFTFVVTIFSTVEMKIFNKV